MNIETIILLADKYADTFFKNETVESSKQARAALVDALKEVKVVTKGGNHLPPECKTEAEKIAYAAGWWKALEANCVAPQPQRVALTPEQIDAEYREHDKAYAFVSSRWSFDAGVQFAEKHHGIGEQQ